MSVSILMRTSVISDYGPPIQEDPLEEEVATQSRSLAREIPWTGEPGRLQSMGLQGTGQDWVAERIYTCSFHKGGLSGEK